MDYETALQKAKDMVNSAKEIAILTHANPTMDSMGGSLALLLGLQSLEKKAVVICPDPMTVGLSSFVGADKVSREFGKKNFVVSFDYEDGSIEKVSYNIEGKKFNLVVEQRPGFTPMSSDKVQYSYQGVSADLFISVDTLNFGQMGIVYEQNKSFITGKPIINIDFHDANVNYGQINLVDPGASSTTELVAEFLATLGVKLTTDIATNLLNAIYDATNNFSAPNVTSMAFEVASVCLKAGAKRFGVSVPSRQTTVGAPQQPQEAQKPKEEPKIYVQNQPVSQNQPQLQQKSEDGKKPVQPPSDWLKPKIFKSSGSMV